MGWKLAELVVEITGQDGALKRTLDSAHRALGNLTKASAGALGELAAGFDRLGGKAAFLLGASASAGGAAMAVGLYKAANAASDLNETLNKAEVVFGPAADAVVADAQQMADAFGYPKKTFLDAAASIGLIGKAAGQTQQQAATMGSEFSKLAADVSSFYNVPLEEALQAIRSGLVGESEPLRRYGVLLSEAAVESEAARMGIARMGDELSEAQKVQARASLITKGFGDAQGDLARTADGAENKQREAWGRLENAAASLGDAVQPAFVKLLSSAAEAFGGLDQWIQGNRAEIAAWGDTVGEWLDTIGVMWRNFGSVAQIVGLTVQEKLINLGELFEWLGQNSGEILSWFASEWPNVIADTFNGVYAIVSNVFTNIKNLFQATFDYIMNPSGGFKFEFTGLLDGFESQISKLPDVAAPHLTSLQQQIDEVGTRMADAEISRLETKARKAAELAAKAGQPKKGGQPGGDEDVPKKKAKEKDEARTSGLEDFAKRIQEGIFSKDESKKIAADQLAVQKEQLKAQAETAAGVAKVAAQLAAGVPAVAM